MEADAAIKKYRHDYYLKNRDRCIQNAKAWQKANPDKYAKNRRRWVIQHYGDFSAYMREWRHKKKMFEKKETP